MDLSTAYSYRERSLFDIKTFIKALRFLFVNVTLAFIFLFLTLEEIDWTLFSFREKIDDIGIDDTSWNIKTIF